MWRAETGQVSAGRAGAVGTEWGTGNIEKVPNKPQLLWLKWPLKH